MTTLKKPLEIKMFNNNCCYCGKFLTIHHFDFTKEHLIPVSKGGNNSLENKVTCCVRCNSMRSNYTFEKFRIKVTQSRLSLYEKEIITINIDFWTEYVEKNKNKLLTKI